MYSMVLMAAMATPADAEAFGKRGGCNGGCTGYVAGCTGCYGYSGGCSGYSYGCCGGTSYGCCGGSSCHGHRSGGFLGGRRNKHASHGCCGGSSYNYGCCGGYIPSGCCGGGYIPSGCCGGVIIAQPAGKTQMPNPDTGKKPGGGAVKPDGNGAFVPTPMPYSNGSVPAVVLPAVAPAPRGIRVE